MHDGGMYSGCAVPHMLSIAAAAHCGSVCAGWGRLGPERAHDDAHAPSPERGGLSREAGVSGHWEGAPTSHMEGYAMHGEGSQTKRGRALSSGRGLVEASLWLRNVFVIVRRIRAGLRENAGPRRRREKPMCVRVACCRYVGGEAR